MPGEPDLPQTKRVRIGLFMFSPLVGGAEQHLKDLIHRLDRERFEVTLFYEAWPEFTDFLELGSAPPTRVVDVRVREPGGHVPTTNTSGRRSQRSDAALGLARQAYRGALPVLQTPILAAYHLWGLALRPGNARILEEAFRANPVDVLHINNGGYPGAEVAREAALSAKRVGVPTVLMTVAAGASPRRYPVASEARRDAAVNKAVDRFFVVARAMAPDLARLHDVAPDKIETLYYGVADPDAKPQTNVVPVIGMNASFIERKGHARVIEAAAVLAREGIDFQIRFAGKGPDEQAIRELVAARGLTDRVTFLGHVPTRDAIAAMAGYDIVTLPSDREGIPYTLMEAASLGKPIVGSTADGIPEIIEDGVNGILVAPRDVTALTAAFRSLLQDPARRAKMGEASRAIYERSFSLPEMVRNHEAAYLRAAGRGAWPAAGDAPS